MSSQQRGKEGPWIITPNPRQNRDEQTTRPTLAQEVLFKTGKTQSYLSILICCLIQALPACPASTETKVTDSVCAKGQGSCGQQHSHSQLQDKKPPLDML